MRTPGELLREARETAGLSLADAAAMTRISQTMLRHLESDRFDEFRADVFVRGHLRNYARDLGIAPEPVLQAYERLVGVVRSSDQLPEVKGVVRPVETTRRAATPKRKAKNTWRKKLNSAMGPVHPTHMLAVVLVLIGVVVFASLLAGNRATAKDPAQFPETSEKDWEIEKDVKETRWLLEQPVQTQKKPAASTER